MNKANFIKAAVAALSGLASSFFHAYGAIFICVCVAIGLDVVTGLIKSKVTGVPISSKVGAAGFWRKVALFFALAFGIFLDAFIPLMFGVVAVDLPFKMPVGMIIGCYIVINESISIFENLDKAAPTALPKWIKKLLKGAGKTIEDGGQTNDKNQSSNT